MIALVVIVAISGGAGTRFNSNLSLPGTDSHAAQALLTANFHAVSGEADQIVFETSGGAKITGLAARAGVARALRRVAGVPGVVGVGSPYAPGGAQISRSGTVAFATVAWDKSSADVTKADVARLTGAARSATAADLRVSLGGAAVTTSERGGLGLSLAVGVLGALAVLLVLFGGALAASVMPLLSAVIALAIANSAIGLLSHVIDVPDVASELATLIGLGVGVDYGLFIISRHRRAVKSGSSYEAAAVEAVTTSGRTVLFAGIIVCIALLGQFSLGIGLLYGLSLSAAIAVALTMATSLTFLPAMLGFLGPRVLSRRERAALSHGAIAATAPGFWQHWAGAVQTRQLLISVASVALLIVLALPTLGLRLGSSDASTDPPGSTSLAAYQTLARGFGPGFSGPLQLASKIHSAADQAAFARLLRGAGDTPGVASVTAAGTSPDGSVVVASLYPSSGPQTRQTVDLVNRIRRQAIPQAEAGTALDVHVGGVTATNIDFSRELGDKLPLFIGVVVLLAFLLLVALFRSLLIPLVASVMNLLAIGAALGALNAVFNWGWGSSLLGLTATGPIDAFLPVLMFSVLFGLSMDYEVFTILRIQEEWHRLRGSGTPARRNQDAITIGQGNSGAVVAAAAGIMVLVFGSFLLEPFRPLQEFGFGLAFSVFVDALVIRSLAVPAVMHLVGPANWSIPAWLNRILPRIAVES